MAADHYAENRVVDAAQTYRPVFVAVQRRGRSKTTEAEAVVAAILDRDRDNVHITFSEPLVGRIAFGGVLIMSGDPLDKERMSRLEAFAGDAEIDALWAKFAESINKAQKDSNHLVETLQAMAVALAALGEGVRQMLLQLIYQKRSA